jgi:hypothetical protein
MSIAGVDWDSFEQQVVGKPFGWNGRGPDTYDCWGLVLAGLKFAGLPVELDWWISPVEQLRVRVPSEIMERQVQTGPWERLSAPEAGCVVALSSHTRIHHVGLMVPSGVLQALPTTGVTRCRYYQLPGQGYQRVECYRWR